MFYRSTFLYLLLCFLSDFYIIDYYIKLLIVSLMLIYLQHLKIYQIFIILTAWLPSYVLISGVALISWINTTWLLYNNWLVMLDVTISLLAFIETVYMKNHFRRVWLNFAPLWRHRGLVYRDISKIYFCPTKMRIKKNRLN